MLQELHVQAEIALPEEDDVLFGASEAERSQWDFVVSDSGVVSLVNCPGTFKTPLLVPLKWGVKLEHGGAVGYILLNTSTSQPTCTPCPPYAPLSP